MRGLSVVLALVLLAGCRPAQVTLALDPGFYPSAVAHDPINDRFFVGSHATGGIAIVGRDGHLVAMVRPEEAPHPVIQLAYEPKPRRLWTLTAEQVEIIDGALPVRRTVVAKGAPGGRFADIAVDAGGRAYVLDATEGTVVAVEPGRPTRVVVRLPAGEGEGSLMLLPDGVTLVVARAGTLWRVETKSGAFEEVRLATPLTDVSQLVLMKSDANAHRVAAFRGRANEIVTLHLSADARRAVADGSTRMRYDTPLHGAFDGREVIVLLGRLRHHPSFGGDGRPNLPPRLATYYAGSATGPRLAEAAPATGPALLR